MGQLAQHAAELVLEAAGETGDFGQKAAGVGEVDAADWVGASAAFVPAGGIADPAGVDELLGFLAWLRVVTADKTNLSTSFMLQ